MTRADKGKIKFCEMVIAYRMYKGGSTQYQMAKAMKRAESNVYGIMRSGMKIKEYAEKRYLDGIYSVELEMYSDFQLLNSTEKRLTVKEEFLDKNYMKFIRK